MTVSLWSLFLHKTKCHTVPPVKQERYVENKGPKALGMKDDNLDDALYNLKVQAVNLVTDALPWLLFGIGAVVVIQLLA